MFLRFLLHICRFLCYSFSIGFNPFISIIWQICKLLWIRRLLCEDNAIFLGRGIIRCKTMCGAYDSEQLVKFRGLEIETEEKSHGRNSEMTTLGWNSWTHFDWHFNPFYFDQFNHMWLSWIDEREREHVQISVAARIFRSVKSEISSKFSSSQHLVNCLIDIFCQLFLFLSLWLKILPRGRDKHPMSGTFNVNVNGNMLKPRCERSLTSLIVHRRSFIDFSNNIHHFV